MLKIFWIVPRCQCCEIQNFYPQGCSRFFGSCRDASVAKFKTFILKDAQDFLDRAEMPVLRNSKLLSSRILKIFWIVPRCQCCEIQNFYPQGFSRFFGSCRDA